ncbi:MAG: hypothetical protein ACI8S6_005829 [Myxococcota bacterium]
MRDRIQALLEADAAEQLIELAHTLRGVPLEPRSAALIRAICTPVEGIDWLLVSSEGDPPRLRAALVAAWLHRWATDPQTDPVAAWLARHAAAEVTAHHALHEGTAALLRQHLPDSLHRRAVDFVSEDRADWQRATPEHRVTLRRISADWLLAQLSA